MITAIYSKEDCIIIEIPEKFSGDKEDIYEHIINIYGLSIHDDPEIMEYKSLDNALADFKDYTVTKEMRSIFYDIAGDDVKISRMLLSCL